MTTHPEIVENLLNAGRIGWAFDPRKGKEVLVERGTGCEIQGDGVPSPRPPQIQYPSVSFDMGKFRAHVGFFEGEVQYMYLDVEGNVTVGIGHLVKDVAAAEALPFYRRHSKQNPHPVHVANAFNKVRRNIGLAKNGHTAFKELTHLDLDLTVIEQIFESDVREFIRQLRGHFKEFDTYPKMAQIGLLDLLYNIGRKNFLGAEEAPAFPLFHKALEYRNWIEVAEQSHRLEKSKEGKIMPGMVNRNTVVREWFLEAIKDDPFFVNPKCGPKNVSMVRGHAP